MSQPPPSTKICPMCFSTDKVYRSRGRNIFEKSINRTKILSFYRCHECGWRGVRFRRIRIKFNVKSLISFIFIILLTYYLINYIIKNYFDIEFLK